MQILFTGASSFTGFWFVKELAKAGHQVTAIFRNSLDSYTGLRKQRIELLKPYCKAIYNCEFGSETFVKAIDEFEKCDLFCHHAADVSNYKSPDFDVNAALANNTKNLRLILEKLLKKNCHKIILTGSIFEPGEGRGSDNLPAFSPYGISKGLTAEIFKFHAEQLQMQLGKFVIPNPFGPFEEPRFTNYLMQNWMQNKVPVVNTPDYIRDNVHISLLAKAYCYFVDRLVDNFVKFNPSGYAESQGAFCTRFADEMRKRLNHPCLFELAQQKDFAEPLMRVNTDTLHHLQWNETQAWDELADFYRIQFNAESQTRI